MAYSYTLFTGNGSTTQYAVAFPYIRREHVAVTVAGIPATFTWVNNSLIQMDAAPAVAAAVRVYRTTPIDAPLVDFADGATLVAADLDTNSRQSIYIQQELDDAQADNLPNVIPNGNKGDITTSVGGTVWAINTGAVTSAKIANDTIVNGNINASAAIAATKLAFTPAGNIAATTVQAAVQELDTEKAPIASPTFTGTPVAPTAATGTNTTQLATTAYVVSQAVAKTGDTMTGDLVLPSLNGGPIAGNRNRIINGAIAIDQRNAGAAQTFTAAAALAYSVDRWYGYCTGANVTGQQVAGATAGQFRYRFTGAASVTAIGFGQRIEQLNSTDLANTTATLSVDLANSLLTTVTWTAYYATTADTFGTLASPTRTQIATGTFTVTSTVTRYSTNISVPAAATTGIEIVFTVGAQTSGTWTIGNVQLEPGTVATPFERRSHGAELTLCQRYYYQTGSSYDFYARSATVSATTYIPLIHEFPVIMRVAPTYSGASATFSIANLSVNSNSTTYRRHLSILGLSNTPNLDAYFILSTGYLSWTAEL